MDIERIIADLVTIYLLWQSNRIFAAQGPPVQPLNWGDKFRDALRYWPMAVMTLLAILIWAQPWVQPYYASASDLRIPRYWIAGLIGAGATVVVVGVLTMIGRPDRRKMESPIQPKLTPLIPIIEIQEPDGGKVPFRKRVRGFAYPTPEIVQVMIYAGSPNDKWWFPQSVAEIKRFEWSCWSRFGGQNTVSGGVFQVCAIIPTQRINDEKIKELPADAIRSKIISVSLDRTLKDPEDKS